MGRARAVGTNQQLASVGAGDLRNRVGEDLDVVGGGVLPAVHTAAS